MALLELRRAIADLVVSVVVKFDEDNNEAGVSLSPSACPKTMPFLCGRAVKPPGIILPHKVGPDSILSVVVKFDEDNTEAGMSCYPSYSPSLLSKLSYLIHRLCRGQFRRG